MPAPDGLLPSHVLPSAILKLFDYTVYPPERSPIPAEPRSRTPPSLFAQSLSLSEVLRYSKEGTADSIQLDKKTGRGWITPKDSSTPIPFHFPPSESLRVMTELRKYEKVDVTFVNRMDFVGDFRSMGPKALIGIGLIIAIRTAMAGAINMVDGINMPVRPGTAAPRPQHYRGPGAKPNSLQNAWARSRLKPVPTTFKGAVEKKVTFEDVAGLGQAKKELSELVEFLKNPARYHAMGARIPRGCLLSGPPGTGKTLLAKAVAGEAEVPFFSLSGSDFMEVYVGVGAARVRELFAEARTTAEGGIIFIDEIDAIGRKRNSSGGPGGGSDERENTLNQLLIEMDGFSQNHNVVVVAASNRCDILDAALTRPGRLDRTIECDLPSVIDRQSILSCHMENVKLDLSSDAHFVRPFEEYEGDYLQMERPELSARETWCNRIAALTPGFSGADLSNVVNEAAILAARMKRRGILLSDLEESVERTSLGLEKDGELPSKERLRKTAFHEAGHAIVGWMLENAEPPIKLSIVPRKSGVLGYAQHIPAEGSLDTRDMILDRLAVLMGGRIAEELVYGQGSTGAEDDLAKASALARAYVSSWAFASDEAGLQTIYSKNLHNQIQRSNEMMMKTDAAVERVLVNAQTRAREIINNNYDAFTRLALALISNETLAYGDMLETIGQGPNGNLSESFRHYLKHEMGEVTVESLPPLRIDNEQCDEKL